MERFENRTCYQVGEFDPLLSERIGRNEGEGEKGHGHEPTRPSFFPSVLYWRNMAINLTGNRRRIGRTWSKRVRTKQPTDQTDIGPGRKPDPSPNICLVLTATTNHTMRVVKATLSSATKFKYQVTNFAAAEPSTRFPLIATLHHPYPRSRLPN